MLKRKKIILLLFVLLLTWITIDINYPFKTDIRKIDAAATANLETAMWRSYYGYKPVKLFTQSAQLMRTVFRVSFWRSYLVSYYNARAPFIFKNGTNRSDYEKALPYLTKFYQHNSDISEISFSADSAAASDLEWWIIRRYRQQHPPAEWEKHIAETASVIHHVSPEKFNEYAHFEVTAMLLRDAKGKNITEEDWQQINALLVKGWQCFSKAVNN